MAAKLNWHRYWTKLLTVTLCRLYIPRPATHECFLSPILHCVIRKFGYLYKQGTYLRNFVPNSGPGKFRNVLSHVLSTKLNRRSSSLSTLATVVAPWLGSRCYLTVWLITHTVYYKSVVRISLTPLLRLAVYLLYKLFLQLCWLLSVNDALISPSLTHLVLRVALLSSVPSTHHFHQPPPLHSFIPGS